MIYATDQGGGGGKRENSDSAKALLRPQTPITEFGGEGGDEPWCLLSPDFSPTDCLPSMYLSADERDEELTSVSVCKFHRASRRNGA